MKFSSALVVITLIIACCFGCFLYYQNYEKEQAYLREQSRLESERLDREQRERGEQERIKRQEEEKERHRENVHDYADRYTAELIVREVYDGGSNVIIDINSYEYNSYSKEYKINIALKWCGRVFTRKCGYSADGIIRVGENGDNLRWESTWHSSDLREYLADVRFLKAAIGTVVVLGAISQAGSGGN